MKPVIAMPRMENSLLRCYMIYKYRQSLRRAGATFEGEEIQEAASQLTKADLMDLGLYGPGSNELRAALVKKLGFPEKISTNAFLQALNLLYDREQLTEIIASMEKDNG